ncbi:MAG: hypothetical protein AAGA68_22380 [Pseudomonadota bacterium]
MKYHRMKILPPPWLVPFVAAAGENRGIDALARLLSEPVLASNLDPPTHDPMGARVNALVSSGLDPAAASDAVAGFTVQTTTCVLMSVFEVHSQHGGSERELLSLFRERLDSRADANAAFEGRSMSRLADAAERSEACQLVAA